MNDVLESQIKAQEDEALKEKLHELNYSYKKTEYNCHKQHHNNPKFKNKLNSLLFGEDFLAKK